MSAVSSSGSFHFRQLQEIECPIEFEPLKKPVMLVGCGHTISEIAAKSLFGEMINEQVKIPNICPLCQSRVTAYYPNLLVKSIVKTILDSQTTEALPTQKITLKDVPFPGIGAKLVLSRGHRSWEIFDDGDSIVRMLKFSSLTGDSLFKSVAIEGYRNGVVAISIRFNFNDLFHTTLVENYFRYCGIDNPNFTGGVYRTEDKHSLKLIYQILTLHNEILDNKFLLIRDLAESGNWFHITPLREGEILPPPRPRTFFDELTSFLNSSLLKITHK